MYSESLRAIATWYPILPVLPPDTDTSAVYEKLKAIARNILDVRAVVDIPSGIDETSLMDSGMSLRLSGYSIAAVTAVFSFTAGGTGMEQEVNLPIHVGRDSIPDAGKSYCILRETLENAFSFSSSDMDVPVLFHPDCIMPRQLPSLLKIYMKDTPSTSGDSEFSSIVYGDLDFADGHNTSLAFYGNSLRITGGSGLGKGIYTEPPYSDVSDYSALYSRGLRGINGLTGDIDISSAGDNLSVTTESTGDVISLSLSVPVSGGAQ